jgi:hypothetical protein
MNLTVDRLLFGLPDLTDDQNNEVIIHRHNIFVNGKVVDTYDKALVNNVKAG